MAVDEEMCEIIICELDDDNDNDDDSKGQPKIKFRTEEIIKVDLEDLYEVVYIDERYSECNHDYSESSSRLKTRSRSEYCRNVESVVLDSEVHKRRISLNNNNDDVNNQLTDRRLMMNDDEKRTHHLRATEDSVVSSTFIKDNSRLVEPEEENDSGDAQSNVMDESKNNKVQNGSTLPETNYVSIDNKKNDSTDIERNNDSNNNNNDNNRTSGCNHLEKTELVDFLQNFDPNVDTPSDNNNIISRNDIKLTRSKLNCTSCAMKDWSEECLALIEKEFPEDTSDDEEYTPDRRNEYDDNFKSTSSKSDLTSASRISSFNNAIYSSSGDNKDAIVENEQTISHRTRSKLPLDNTSMETIEHSFLFPDITTDMYDTECDDTEWINFLKECNNQTNDAALVNDDHINDDPEYVVPPVDEQENVDDYTEEYRIDHSVKITQQECDYLINEILQENVACDTTLPHVFSSQSVINSDNSNYNNDYYNTNAETNYNYSDYDGFLLRSLTKFQMDILKQQIRQHIQLLTQDFVKSYKHPTWHELLSSKIENMIRNWNLLSTGKNYESTFKAINLTSAIDFIADWKMYVNEKVDAIAYFREYRKKFDQQMMKMICSAECLFVYPHLLPSKYKKYDKNDANNYYFNNNPNSNNRSGFTKSEDMLISIGLQQYGRYVTEQYNGNGKKVTDNALLRETVRLINEYLVPCRSSFHLEDYIKHRRRSKSDNPIKYYYRNDKVMTITNYLYPFDEINKLPLFDQPDHRLPMFWRKYIYAFKYSNVRPIPISVKRPILPKSSVFDNNRTRISSSVNKEIVRFATTNNDNNNNNNNNNKTKNIRTSSKTKAVRKRRRLA